MSTFSTVLLIIVVSLLGFAGYYYLDQIVPLQATCDELRERNQEYALRLQQYERDLAQLEKQVEEKSRESQEQINKLKSTYDELVGSLKEEVEKGEITITRIADQLNVKIVDRIIFPSGKAELSPAGIKVLENVGKVLQNTSERRIRVEGHTDNVPIHPNLQDEFASNWELSVARATNVVRFLQEEAGIDPSRLEATGLGQFSPVATNKTRQGRMKNRRIEIKLLPTETVLKNVEQHAAQKM